jgi:glycosyltransferase involved in cell wall biosynthesis
MRDLRILTFNWHESYLHLLASVGHQWDVVLRLKGGREDWWHEVRPVPERMTLVPERDALASLVKGGYDVVVCHNLLDLGLVVDSGVPAITVFHTSRDLEVANGLNQEAFDTLGRPLLERSTVVFVSEMKRMSWNLAGEVVLPGIDLSLYGGYDGQQPRILHVGNLKQELARFNGMRELESSAAGLPFTLLGLNPTIQGAGLSRDWDDLRDHFRGHRAYLHTTRMPFEDGYNLAMLEAMATGMPVVALAHPTCPLTHGLDGFVCADVAGLRLALLELLEDPGRACALGRAARDTVGRLFPIDVFRAQWETILRSSVVGLRSDPERYSRISPIRPASVCARPAAFDHS